MFQTQTDFFTEAKADAKQMVADLDKSIKIAEDKTRAAALELAALSVTLKADKAARVVAIRALKKCNLEFDRHMAQVAKAQQTEARKLAREEEVKARQQARKEEVKARKRKREEEVKARKRKREEEVKARQQARKEESARKKQRTKYVREAAKIKDKVFRTVDMLGNVMGSTTVKDMFGTEEEQGKWWLKTKEHFAIKNPRDVSVYQDADADWQACRKNSIPGSAPLPAPPLPLPAPLALEEDTQDELDDIFN